jgi:hypothetical protein
MGYAASRTFTGNSLYNGVSAQVNKLTIVGELDKKRVGRERNPAGHYLVFIHFELPDGTSRSIMNCGIIALVYNNRMYVRQSFMIEIGLTTPTCEQQATRHLWSLVNCFLKVFYKRAARLLDENDAFNADDATALALFGLHHAHLRAAGDQEGLTYLRPPLEKVGKGSLPVQKT